MDFLTRDPIVGALWREIVCFLQLGFQWRIFWGIISAVTFRSYVFTFDLLVTLLLAWNSITKREVSHGGPYSIPNMILRLSVSLAMLSMGIYAFVLSWRWTSSNVETLQIILGSLLNFIIFASIRHLWNTFLLIGMCYDTAVIIIDPRTFFDRCSVRFDELYARTSYIIRSVLDQQKIKRAIFIASEPLEQETYYTLQYGLFFSGGATLMIHVTEIQIWSPLIAVWWLWTMKWNNGTMTEVTTGFRQIVRMVVDILVILIGNALKQLSLQSNAKGYVRPDFIFFFILYVATRLVYNALHGIPHLPENNLSGLRKRYYRIINALEWMMQKIPQLDDLSKEITTQDAQRFKGYIPSESKKKTLHFKGRYLASENTKM